MGPRCQAVVLPTLGNLSNEPSASAQSQAIFEVLKKMFFYENLFLIHRNKACRSCYFRWNILNVSNGNEDFVTFPSSYHRQSDAVPFRVLSFEILFIFNHQVPLFSFYFVTDPDFGTENDILTSC